MGQRGQTAPLTLPRRHCLLAWQTQAVGWPGREEDRAYGAVGSRVPIFLPVYRLMVKSCFPQFKLVVQ